MIEQLEAHIVRLREILASETTRIQDDEAMYNRGAITAYDYRQSLLDYRSKCVLLDNMSDDLWLYSFFAEFY